MRTILAAFFALAGATVSAQEQPPVIQLLRDEATRLAPLVESPFGKALLAAVPELPAKPGTRIVYYNRATRDALSQAEAASRGDSALSGYEKRELDEHFYYYTKYGTPLASLRAFDLVGQAGLGSVAGQRVLDFGFGSIGQLRLLASLGAEVTGVEVDALLQKLYAEPGDVSPGKIQLLFGAFPADSALAARAGRGYALFVSKNTLKRGYIHPERDVDPKFLVHLGVDDATYVRAVFALLNSGGYFMIYNLSPAPSKPDEPYKPWSDGRSPFTLALFQDIGFEVLAFDQDDTPTARKLGKTLGWDADMTLETDLFGTYTLVRKP